MNKIIVSLVARTSKKFRTFTCLAVLGAAMLAAPESAQAQIPTIKVLPNPALKTVELINDAVPNLTTSDLYTVPANKIVSCGTTPK